MRWFCLLLITVVVGLVGCAEPTPSTKVEVPDATVQIKSSLDQIAAAGELDSSLVAVREELEKMKETEPAKAEALLKELDELQSMTDSNQIKSKAQEMSAKL